MNLLFVLHTPRRAVRHRNDKGQRTKDKPQAKQSLLRPSRPLESLVKQGVGVERQLAQASRGARVHLRTHQELTDAPTMSTRARRAPANSARHGTGGHSSRLEGEVTKCVRDTTTFKTTSILLEWNPSSAPEDAPNTMVTSRSGLNSLLASPAEIACSRWPPEGRA